MNISESRIRQIADYIILKYPDSCLAQNTKMNGYDLSVSVTKCRKFFYYEKLDWCGCGDPDAALGAVRDYLRFVRDRRYPETWDQEEAKCKERLHIDSMEHVLVYCLAYTIDAAGFTEHGSSVGGCWLTDEGKMFLELIDEDSLELDD